MFSELDRVVIGCQVNILLQNYIPLYHLSNGSIYINQFYENGIDMQQLNLYFSYFHKRYT